MSEDFFPTQLDEIVAWAKRQNISLAEARQRFAQFAILFSIAASRRLSQLLVFKGGNALDFFWHSNRSTQDLDFSVGETPSEEIPWNEVFGSAFTVTASAKGVLLRVQRAERRPPGASRTWPSWNLKIGYALPEDRSNRRKIEARQAVPTVVPVEISLNDVVCAEERQSVGGSFALRVCTLEDIVAEKLRAYLQQTKRNRFRKQDLLDIAAIRVRGLDLDLERVALFLRAKAAARDVFVSKEAFRDPDLVRRAQTDYAQLKSTTREIFLPAPEALAHLLALVDALPL